MVHTTCQELTIEQQAHATAQALDWIDPLTDPRWDDFVKGHSHASLFHSSAWLKALERTYGYEPRVYTTSGLKSRLENGIVFCRVDSWLTGHRLVSLPFSDHCAPLVRGEDDLASLATALAHEACKQSWRYIELRPLAPLGSPSAPARTAATYTLHQLDLTPSLDALFAGFHRDSIQRKIQRAERESLIYQEGSDESILDVFYPLLVITRRRHRIPPQPRRWFRNLIDCFGSSLKIRIASKDGRPIAGMLTIRHKDTLVYKYGGSDVRFNNLGGMHLLYWRSIIEAKNSGLRTFDLGRSDADQTGLITFKRRWGAAESKLTYLRFAPSGNSDHMFDPSARTWKARLAKRVFASMPTCVLSAAGTVLYRHIG